MLASLDAAHADAAGSAAGAALIVLNTPQPRLMCTPLSCSPLIERMLSLNSSM
ncbi:hypothetical protein DP49_4160 [Burkholderia pseudomallei]|nr:hypothetical protein DP49_4160 [Burkholderia pseudomallei]